MSEKLFQLRKIIIFATKKNKMKSLKIIAILLLFPFFSFAQNEWTKADRTNVYEECLSIITKYKSLSKSQKETLALCYLEEVTKNYTKKEYQAKIDIEIERIQSATILHCSKNIGVELENGEKNSENISFSNKDLVGSWKTENCEFYLIEDGSYLIKWFSGKTASGKWHLEDKNIVLKKFSVLKVVSFTGKVMKYVQGGKVWTAERIN